jgi:hypothetical protein
VDNYSRELSGAIVRFEDGARVSKISLASDFSAVRINGLPAESTPSSVAVLLTELSFEIPAACIRMTLQDGYRGMSADIRVEDPTFATRLCSTISGKRTERKEYSQLQVVSVPTSMVSQSAFNRVDCRSVSCSWYKASRIAFLTYGDEGTAQRHGIRFNSGAWTVSRKPVTCDPPTQSPGSFNRLKWTLVMKDLPSTSTEEDIKHSILERQSRPRHIELGPLTSSMSNKAASTAVKEMLLRIGPLDSWNVSEDSSVKRVKATGRFGDEVTAREASRRLDGAPLSFLKNGKLSMKVITSAKFKITTNLYDVVKPEIDAERGGWRRQYVTVMEYRNTDSAQKYTAIKVYGEDARAVAKAKDSLERILEGEVAMDGDVPIWHDSLKTRSNLRKLKQIQEDLGVLVICDSRRSRLQLYGPSELREQAHRALRDSLNTNPSDIHVIELDQAKLGWALGGGFRRIESALGKDVASINIASNPKRITIAGSNQNYQTALRILRDQITEERAEKEMKNDCAVCWTEAENPIRTSCHHVYCLECFEHQCSSAASGDKECLVRCHGNSGTCNFIFHLDELKENLSSTAFEDLLQSSFTSYVRCRPHIFRYCPTPDCNQIYRTENASTVSTCPKCVIAICKSCHVAHENMTCAEHKDAASGGLEALEKLKLTRGYKDCPQCKTTMEKIDGCNHIVCSGCKIHICWVCMQTFTISQSCYTHMNARHGGIGLGWP